MQNEIEQLAQQNDMSIEFVTWFFNEKKANCGNVWFMMMAAMWEGWKGRSIEMDKLAAENVALKLKGRELLNEASKVYQKYNATIDFYSGDFMDGQTLHEFQFVLDAETSGTDAYLAGIKADGVEEFAESQKEYVRQHRNEMDQVLRAAYAGSAVDAERFAKQLREGADK